MSVIIGGTIAIDHVKTPNAEGTNLLGGSAAYASLAASYFCDEVNLVGIVGHDYPEEHLKMLSEHGVGLEGVERSDAESFTWTGEYYENMNDRETHSVALNVLEGWEVTIPDSIADAEMVVLANMSPENQMQMLDQCVSGKRFVIADTMDLWIKIANERLNDVMGKIDVLVINESEAREFAATPNLVIAGERLLEKGPRYVIIKLGEFGAMLFGPAGKMFRCAAWPLRAVSDPTGAGDAFLGGMAGYLSSLGADSYGFSDLKQGMIRGTVAASYTCEAFSTQRLQEVSAEDLTTRMEDLREMSVW